MSDDGLSWFRYCLLFCGDADGLERQRAFYRDVIGLTESKVTDTMVDFDVGGHTLELGVNSETTPTQDQRFVPMFQVADIQAARDRLLAGGAEPVTDIRGQAPGGQWCYFRDPAGVVFGLQQPPTSPS